MHFMATYFLVLMLWPFKTSEKAPSPFFAIKVYSMEMLDEEDKLLTVHFEILNFINNPT